MVADVRRCVHDREHGTEAETELVDERVCGRELDYSRGFVPGASRTREKEHADHQQEGDEERHIRRAATTDLEQLGADEPHEGVSWPPGAWGAAGPPAGRSWTVSPLPVNSRKMLSRSLPGSMPDA